MAEKINVNVNQFPSLTWNHLNINRSHFEGSLVRARISSEEKQFILPNEIQYEQKLLKDIPEAESFYTGLGKDFDKELNAVSEKLNAAVNTFTVPAGVKIQKSVKTLYEAVDGDESFSDVYIIAGENSESTFIFDYTSSDSCQGLFGLRIKVMALDSAKVHIVTVNRLGKNYVCFNGCASLGLDNSSVEFTQLELGGKDNYNGLQNILSGYQSKYEGQHAYIVSKDSKLDLNQIVVQTGRNSESKYTVDGVLMQNGKKTWRGTIDFKHGCIDAKGDEQEDVLLLNPEVVNKSLPVILCDEEAVEGRHGCSIGKVDMENLFYMQSRGVDFQTAKELMLKAKVRKVLHHIDDKELSDNVEAFTDKLLQEV